MKPAKRLSAIVVLVSALAAAAQTPGHRSYGVWRSSVIGGGGYLQQVHFCPTDANRLYMSSDVGGVFRSDDRGATWRMLHGSLPPGGGAYEIRGLLVDPGDADHVLIACGDTWHANRGIYVTRDGGKSWKQTLKALFPGNGSTRAQGLILVASPRDRNVLLAAADDGIFRSEDMGETWTALTMSANIASPGAIVFDRNNPRHVWLCVAAANKERVAGLFVSEDEGKTFSKLSDTSPSEFVQDPQDAKVLYGLLKQRPVRSSDGGLSWSALDQALPKAGGPRDDGTYGAIAASPDFIILGGHGGNFYRLVRETSQWAKIERSSVDEGQWWGRMRPGMYTHFGSALGYIAINPRDPNNWFFTDWYACYVTTDAGKSWKLCIDGVEMTVIHTVVQDPFDKNLVHVGTADIGYFRSTDGGETFEWRNQGISNNIKCIATTPAKQGRMYAVGPQDWHWYANQVFVSDDAGQNWRRPAMKGLPNMKEARCNTICVSPKNADEVYITVSGAVGRDGGGVYRSSNAGESWEWVGEGLPPEPPLFRKDIWVHGPELAVSGDGSMVAISCDRNRLFRYDAAGKTWTTVALPASSGSTNAVIADPSTASRFYLAMKEGGFFGSSDGGASWKRLSIAPTFWASVDAANPRRLAIFGTSSACVSSDAGETWTELDEGLPYRQARNVICFTGERLVVGTGGNGVFWTPLPPAGAKR